MSILQQEYDRLQSLLSDDHVLINFKPELEAIVSKFESFNYTGENGYYAASFLSSAVYNLCLGKHIEIITNNQDDWQDVSTITGFNNGLNKNELFQHKALNTVLKKGINGKPWYVNALVFVDETGVGFGGTAETEDGVIVNAARYIKSFPFEPKTYPVAVKTVKTVTDSGVERIKRVIVDYSQVEAAFELYEPDEIQ